MKKNSIFLFLGLSLCIVCISCAKYVGSQSNQGIPEWYGKALNESHKIIGYGSGKSLSVADKEALTEISQKFEVWVKSKSITQESKSTLSGKTSVEHYYEQRISTRTKRKLKNPKRVKKEVLHNKIFVRWEVDLRPEWQQLADKMIKKWKTRGKAIPSKLVWSGDTAYTSSHFSKKAKEYIESKGGLAKQRRVHIGLFRKYNQWYIRADNLSQSLQDIYTAVNISSYEKGNIELQIISPDRDLLGHRLSEGQHFCLQVNSSKQLDNCSLVNIYPDGRVTVLKECSAFQEGKNVFPSREGKVYQSSTIEGKKVSLDVYVAICTSTKSTLTEFRLMEMDDQLPSGRSAYKVEKFISWIERSKIKALDSQVVETH